MTRVKKSLILDGRISTSRRYEVMHIFPSDTLLLVFKLHPVVLCIDILYLFYLFQVSISVRC